MNITNLRPSDGAKTEKYRVGRGHGSGNGKTAGRGHKGQKARSGGGVRLGFEGGQLPIYLRLPKRGFTNIFASHYAVVNIRDLNKVVEDVIDINLLKKRKLVLKKEVYLVVLGNGSIDRKITVIAKRVSKSAREKIEAAGGKVEVI